MSIGNEPAFVRINDNTIINLQKIILIKKQDKDFSIELDNDNRIYNIKPNEMEMILSAIRNLYTTKGEVYFKKEQL